MLSGGRIVNKMVDQRHPSPELVITAQEGMKKELANHRELPEVSPRTISSRKVHERFLDFVDQQGATLDPRLTHNQLCPDMICLEYYLYSGYSYWDIDTDLASFADALLAEKDWQTLERYEQYGADVLRCFSLSYTGHNPDKAFSRLRMKADEIKTVLGQRHADSESLFGKLLESGVSELYAEIIVQQFECLEHWYPAQPSKNVVYHIEDEKGNKKVLKFVPGERKIEAEIEATVLREFKNHPILQRYVPASFFSEPINVSMGNYFFKLLIEEDVTGKSPEQPIGYWVQTLARIHHFGTQIMDKINNYKPALRLAKDKDEARIEEKGMKVDQNLRKETIAEHLEERNIFIHQDIRSQNRVGKYAIDWGHSGRGNPYLDLARILLDSQVQQQRVYGPDDYKKSLALYLRERKKLARDTVPINLEDIEGAYLEFTKISLLYAQSQTAYLREKGKLCTPKEIQNTEFLDFMRKQLETKLQRRRN